MIELLENMVYSEKYSKNIEAWSRPEKNKAFKVMGLSISIIIIFLRKLH